MAEKMMPYALRMTLAVLANKPDDARSISAECVTAMTKELKMCIRDRLICVPIVTACIKKGIAVAVDAINAQTQNIKVQRLVREIGDAVANAVAAMNQTYVNDLKAAKTFNEAEQKEALMRAVSAALKSMSRDAQDYIKSNFGDTTQYLENRIEAQIDANHVAAQNTLNLS